jgi:hypothetical protein
MAVSDFLPDHNGLTAIAALLAAALLRLHERAALSPISAPQNLSEISRPLLASVPGTSVTVPPG